MNDSQIGKSYEYSENFSCGSPDVLGVTHQVLKSRVCDGIRDCNGGEDEDGSILQCPKPSGDRFETENGCCKYLTVTDQDNIYQCIAKV